MGFPSEFIEHIQHTTGFDKDAFEAAHQASVPVSIRYNPNKKIQIDQAVERVPWTSEGYYLSERPSFVLDPLWHAGVYYVQEASSMLLEQAVQQTTDLNENIKVLDLCAAPGGKSTLLQSIITKESLLVANEVIQSRASILRENIIKWGGMNVVVTHNDPADFSAVEGFFDLMVVDAPCSGSGLFRKDPEAMDEWSLSNVKLCAERQKRILVDVWPALKEEGILIYSTCSYSEMENEAMVDWIMQTFDLVSVSLELNTSWGVREVISSHKGYGYRCWPDKVKGEGFFMAVFKKKEVSAELRIKSKRNTVPSVSDKNIAASFIKKATDIEWMMQGKYLTAINAAQFENIQFLMERLRVRYAGVESGVVLHGSFMPEHPLAVSYEIQPDMELVNLTDEQAILFLRKEDIGVSAFPKGWQRLGYRERGIGWVKSLGNRINNYYPKEWRIRQRV
jgi:16S rRNA C967 or C1407 C5-methylase (RsmB/RsmF family)/NOL1/NOP2/fmu family ribosome biogenesis protein